MKLSEKAEEVAGFYARMLDHEYTTREVFNKNFFNDWRGVCTSSVNLEARRSGDLKIRGRIEFAKSVSI